MSSDKLRQGVAVVPEFVDGETVRAAKLNAIGSQLQRAASQLEKAVGDVHDDSYPYSSLNSARLSIAWGRSLVDDQELDGALTRSLDIANLARLIGPASNLNPVLPTDTVTITEVVPSGVYEFTLRFVPLAVVSSTDTSVATAVADTSLLTTTGHYVIDSVGMISTYTATVGGTITYTLRPYLWGSGPNYTGATFNVIPDPVQLDNGGDGCIVDGSVDSQGRHTITLPVCTHLSRDADGTSVELTTKDPWYNEQLVLPRVLTDNYVSEEIIPDGFLYLRNWTTGEVYRDATYYYSAEDTILIGGVDLSDEVDAGDQFLIVTVGTDITSTLDDLRTKMSTHSHNRALGETAIEAESIVGWTKVAGTSGRFVPSTMSGNYAPQYLHRDGYSASESDLNDQNIMRGHLVIGRSGSGAGDYLGDAGSSRSLYFGSTSGPRIYKSSSTVFEILNPLGSMNIGSTGATADITIDSGRDVRVKGGIRQVAGYVTSTTTPIDNCGLYAGALAGHSCREFTAEVAESAAFGPFSADTTDNIPLWEIDVNGSSGAFSDGTDHGNSHYATTQNTTIPDDDAWVVPRFFVLHLAQRNVEFEPKMESGATPSTISDIDHWQMNWDLPNYILSAYNDDLNGNAILGVTAMVQSSEIADRWFTTGAGRFGGGQGEEISVYINKDTDLHILISATGSNQQAFHRERFGSPSDPATNIEVDVKITLIVASHSQINF